MNLISRRDASHGTCRNTNNRCLHDNIERCLMIRGDSKIKPIVSDNERDSPEQPRATKPSLTLSPTPRPETQTEHILPGSPKNDPRCSKGPYLGTIHLPTHSLHHQETVSCQSLPKHRRSSGHRKSNCLRPKRRYYRARNNYLCYFGGSLLYS